MRDALARAFAVDLRSLALFRIAVAGAVLFDLATRAGDLVAHYTDAGVLPAQAARALGGRLELLSIHVYASGSPWAVGALFAFAAVAGVALALGWRTRLATILTWYLLVSLQMRNPYVSRLGGDTLLRLLLFWSMFLPLGARFSLDARRRPTPGPNALVSLPGAALLLQVAIMYVVTGWWKIGPAWLNGRAVWYALQLDYYATGLGVWLREHGSWTEPLTYATVWLERWGPLLAFAPVGTDVLRMLAIVLFVGFHLSLAALMDIGWFPLFSIVAWTAFVPGRFWDAWLPALRRRARASVPRPSALPGPPSRGFATQPLWVQALAAPCLAYVLVSVAVASGPPELDRPLPAGLVRFGKLLRLQQRWNMFAPDPIKDDRWPLVEGVLADGRHRDLLRGGAFALEKPERLPSVFPSFRWRIFFRSTTEDQGRRQVEILYRNYARFLCRSARSAGPDARLVRVRIHHATETTMPRGPLAPRYELLGDWPCVATAAPRSFEGSLPLGAIETTTDL